MLLQRKFHVAKHSFAVGVSEGCVLSCNGKPFPPQIRFGRKSGLSLILGIILEHQVQSWYRWTKEDNVAEHMQSTYLLQWVRHMHRHHTFGFRRCQQVRIPEHLLCVVCVLSQPLPWLVCVNHLNGVHWGQGNRNPLPVSSGKLLQNLSSNGQAEFLASPQLFEG